MRYAIPVAGLLVLFALACQGEEETAQPAFTPTPTPSPTATRPSPTPRLTLTPDYTFPPVPIPNAEVLFDFGEDVTIEDQTYLREGIRIVREWLRANLRTDLREDTTVKATAYDPSPGSCCLSGSHQITIYTLHPAWRAGSPFARQRLIAHEYVHILQQEQTALFSVPRPFWLFEGSAEFIAYEAMVEQGLITRSEVRTFHIQQLKSAKLPTLRSLEFPQGVVLAPDVPSLFYLAVELLVEEKGNLSLRRYFEGLSRSDDWRSVFRESFGTSIDSFYREFEEYRRKL